MASAAKHRLPEAAVRALVEARHDDPFAVLGPHEVPGGVVDPRAGAGCRAAGGGRGGDRRGRRRAGAPARGGPVRGRARGPAGLVRLHAARAQRGRHRGRCTTPTASHRSWARWTTISSARARIGACGSVSARMRSSMPAWRGSISRSGRRTRRASRWSATSTAGTGGATRCGGAAGSASGRSSSPGSARGRSTSTSCAPPTARSCRLKADPVGTGARAAAAERVGGPAGRRLHLERCRLARRAAAPRRRSARRSASSRCISAPGRAARATGS